MIEATINSVKDGVGRQLKAVVDPLAGFCGGVNRAIDLVEKALRQGKPLAVKGELIHNRLEMERLYLLGLKPIRNLGHAKGYSVLVRTHGEEESFFRRAAEFEISTLDATCPKVMRSQKVIRQAFEEGKQIIIVGHLNHPEVIALQGHCNGGAVVVNAEEGDVPIDFDKPTLLIAQTTVSPEVFLAWQKRLKGRIKNLQIFDSRCSFVTRRQKELVKFASSHPAVVFVGGKHSSNSNLLFSVCSKINPDSVFIEDETELDADWLKQFDRVGVTGSASTPMWLLKKVADKINETAR